MRNLKQIVEHSGEAKVGPGWDPRQSRVEGNKCMYVSQVKQKTGNK